MREQDEVKEILSDLRRDLIVAVNAQDSVSFAFYTQEILIGATFLEDEEERKELGVFIYNMNKTYKEIKGDN